jgi:hypothetical protein
MNWFRLALGLSFVVACSSGSSPGGGSGGTGGGPAGTGGTTVGTGGAGGVGVAATTPQAYKTCDQTNRVGGFVVDLKSNAGSTPFTAISGGAKGGVDPTAIWEEAAKDGDCRLMVGRMLVCNTPCPGGKLCAGSNMCIDEPLTQDTGTLTITGLAGPVSLMWISGQGYSGSLTNYPPAAPEVDIGLKTSGGKLPAISLAGRGIEPLQFAGTGLKVARNQPLAVSWTAPARNKSTRVRIKLDIAHHGGIAARIDCDVADTGSTAISATLVTKLMDRGLAGFPTISLTRQTSDATSVGPGCADFAVASEESRDIEVEGVVSCTQDGPCSPGDTGCKTCPTGMTCGKDLRCK